MYIAGQFQDISFGRPRKQLPSIRLSQTGCVRNAIAGSKGQIISRNTGLPLLRQG